MKFVIMMALCPRFLADLPPKRQESTSFLAEAYTQSLFGYKHVRFSEKFDDIRSAYFAARWAALDLDWSLPHGEFAIMWSVKIEH